tara:strand:+ start:4972 stop:5298 length:327 start_codon:yes stop_codon:yes gene_type:complete
MIKSFKFVIILVSFLILNSCGTMREGFSSQKKSSIDEFLVEKKSPLVMPPDFNDLPQPKENNQIQENVDEKNIKALITENEEINVDNQKSSNQNLNFENSIIEKIKNN